ncbi:PREDICTED: anthocyanin 5-aromatic acyltransferase-like [Nelumbo nucifera]|uniref:Uncharacterized protein n=2 Tax=Nelumbo nucifera TaxID=4432 RepID=A0A822XTJ4_NELNU|nr:PREDICTED: anthocyanin 5-aromatic acyltransferase-like [Nelumbo nucifera]DAD22491.1 TPA_asm: hypothetical protein HUJ06_023954 [Nelumbo nucifera]
MAAIHSIKVLEKCQVSPPAASMEKKSLQLTFFDVMYLYYRCPSRIFFYEFPHPITLFMESIIPNLKNSLSLTLQHFYFLAGNLMWVPPTTEPEIRFVSGDSVSFTIAESTDNFSDLCGDHPRDESQFDPLIPQLPSLFDSNVVPLLALQVTFFPNSGFSIGITSSHVVSDGRSLCHFIRSWATACRLGGDSSACSELLPFYERTVIDDPEGYLKTILLKEMENYTSKMTSNISDDSQPSFEVPTESIVVRATFVVSRVKIDQLKQWILARHGKNENQIVPLSSLRLSAFVVTCAITWVCLIKAGVIVDSPGKEMEHFLFSVDCRDRLRNPPVPATYFGNCVALGFADAKKTDLEGDNAIVVAAKMIADAVKRMEYGVLRDAERWISDLSSRLPEGFVTVTGSPKFGVYEMDFGWGKPKKFEMLRMGEGQISLFDSRDGEGAVEVGLALPKAKMEAFTTFFADYLKLCNS